MEGIESGGGSGVVSEDTFEVSRLRKGLKRNGLGFRAACLGLALPELTGGPGESLPSSEPRHLHLFVTGGDPFSSLWFC